MACRRVIGSARMEASCSPDNGTSVGVVGSVPIGCGATSLPLASGLGGIDG